MAALAAARAGSGTGKCGWPMLRLTGSLSVRPSSNTRRTPDIAMPSARSEIQSAAGGFAGPISPLQDLVRAAAGRVELLGNAFQFALHLAHRLRPFHRAERQ